MPGTILDLYIPTTGHYPPYLASHLLVARDH